LEDLGVDGRIILKQILKDKLRGCGLDLSGSGRNKWLALNMEMENC
jgi:hypothetical protein